MKPNWMLLVPAGVGAIAVVAGLVAGAHALGKRRRGPWLMERGAS